MTASGAAGRLAWHCAAWLGAALVIGAATWWLGPPGAVRETSLYGEAYGDGGGRAVTALEVVAGSADVSLTPRGDGPVGYRADFAWSRGEPAVERSRLGDTLRLTPRCAGPAGASADLGCSIRLTVTVPPGIPVKVSGGSGRVSVTGLEGPLDADVDSGTLTLSALRGPVRAHVGTGRLVATGLASPQAEIRADSGRADATFEVAPERVTARVGEGRLVLNLPGEARYRVRDRVGAGRCEVADSLRDPASARVLDVAADAGHATVAHRGARS
ncbi:hypothetical protein [Streptomyces sp. NPDC048606]|uniref:hypothetical protein n=1 Tax=Streptomyces sp. NPDC048606 TaxID=3154726 RepID=UPI00343956A5